MIYHKNTVIFHMISKKASVCNRKLYILSRFLPLFPLDNIYLFYYNLFMFLCFYTYFSII